MINYCMIVHVHDCTCILQVVSSSQQYNNFYVTRARQELHLHNYYANSPTGVYCCDVQSVNGSGNITAEYVSETNYTSINSSTSKCVGLYNSCEYEPCMQVLPGHEHSLHSHSDLYNNMPRCMRMRKRGIR